MISKLDRKEISVDVDVNRSERWSNESRFKKIFAATDLAESEVFPKVKNYVARPTLDLKKSNLAIDKRFAKLNLKLHKF